MTPIRPRLETALLCACLGLVALALWAPAMAQPGDYHHFADRRTFWGVPFAMDVLSNGAFAVAGMAGLARLSALPARTLSNMQRAMAILFFVGLLFTAAASSWYHSGPDDARLVVDRCGMAVAFAGLLGLAAASQVSERAGAALGLAALILGAAAIEVWSTTGNVLPWATLQAGGAALICWMALLRSPARGPDVRWSLLMVAYATAKLCELNDAEVYRLTGEIVSGHALKHVIAAVSAAPVLSAMRAMRPRQHWHRAVSAPPSTGRLRWYDPHGRSGQ